MTDQGKKQKMNNSLQIIFALFIIAVLVCSCDITKKNLSAGLEFRIDDVQVDKVGNYYLTDYRGEIRKYSDVNKLQYSFKNYNIGEIAVVDLTNPHKILVFFKDFQTLLVLDNTLSPIQTIKLSYTDYCTAAGTSNDGNIWLYNSIGNTLKKVSYDGSIILESIPLNHLMPLNIRDAKITERDNMLFIYDENKGLLLFNNLGIFSTIIPLTQTSKFQFTDNNIYFLDNETYEFISYDIRSKRQEIVADLEDYKPQKAIIYGNYILIIRNNTVETFSLK